MTDTISSRLSSLDRPSVISVVWDAYFLNPGERKLLLLGLMGTVDNGDKSNSVPFYLKIRDKHFLPRFNC